MSVEDVTKDTRPKMEAVIEDFKKKLANVRTGRATVTISNIRDSAGQLVADGTMLVVTTNNCAIRQPGNNACFTSVGGVIIGGQVVSSNSLLRAFPVQNGQVVFEYSAQVPPLVDTPPVTFAVAQPTVAAVFSTVFSGERSSVYWWTP